MSKIFKFKKLFFLFFGAFLSMFIFKAMNTSNTLLVEIAHADIPPAPPGDGGDVVSGGGGDGSCGGGDGGSGGCCGSSC
jgi:hypothetical protein